MNLACSAQDRLRVRELARQVAAIGHLPIQQERIAAWTRHNDLERGRPLVLVFPEGAWRELLPDSDLRLEGELARSLERGFRRQLYYHEVLQDDSVIEPVFPVGLQIRDSGWGVEPRPTRPADATGAVHYEPVIQTDADLDRIRMPQVEVDWEATAARAAFFEDLLDGTGLRVELRSRNYHTMAILDEFATWRGPGQLLLDLVDRPDWVHEAMRRMCGGMMARHEALRRVNGLRLNNRNHYTGSGGTGYTRHLPRPGFDGTHVRSEDLWGFSTTQIFSEVSPEMHETFALAYERRFLAMFGLVSYGCCEPLHRKLDLVKTIPNLRRVSISPWADVAVCAESLGDRVIFSHKPNPAVVAGEHWDPEAARHAVRRVLEQTRGCVLEMILKDTHTCRGDPRRMRDWVRLAREEAAAVA